MLQTGDHFRYDFR